MIKEKSNNLKLEYEVEVKELYIVNKDSFYKEIKKFERYCKVLNFPLPKVEKISEGSYSKIFRDDDVIIETNDSLELQRKVSELNLEKIVTYGVDGKKSISYKSDTTYYNYKTIPFVTKYKVELVTNIKPHNSWNILGTINFKDGLINDAPNYEVPKNLIPSNLYGKSHCDHCKTERYRNKIVFIQNENDEIIQVGGSCIRYYLGYDYNKVIESLNLLSRVFEMNVSEFYDNFSSYKFEKTYSAISLIQYYIHLVETTKSHITNNQAKNYNSNLDENEDGEYKRKISTSNLVINDLVYASHQPEGRNIEKEDMEYWVEFSKYFFEKCSKVDNDKVDNIIDFVEEKSTESNFMLNALNKIKEGELTHNTLSIVSGAISYYYAIEFSKKKKEKEETNKISKHIGNIGEKVSFENLEILKIRGFETQFGWSYIYIMEDEDGNKFTKFGKINNRYLVDGEDVEEGSFLSFTSDVKKHDEYKGVKQTVLGRLSKYNKKLKY